MKSSRRTFMGLVAPAVALWGALRAFGSQDPPPKAPRPPFPSKDRTQEDAPPTPDPHAVLKSYEKDIKKDVQKLLELAQELKKEIDKTDSAEVLNLSMLKKAEEIEKLAHKIQSMARG